MEDMTQWMRGDERPASNSICMQILLCRLAQPPDEDGLNELRGKWEQILATLPFDEVLARDLMWAEIEAGVLR